MSNLQNSLGLGLASSQASSMANNASNSSSSSSSGGNASSSSSSSNISSSSGGASSEWQQSVAEAQAHNQQQAQNTAGVVQFNQGQNINNATISTGNGQSQNYGNYLNNNQSAPTINQPIQPMQNAQPQAEQVRDWKFQQNQKDWQERQNILWEQRQKEMQDNMRKMQNETSDFLTDRNKFNLMTGYENKNEQERKVVDEYWKNNQHEKPKSANDYYNQIKSGIVPSDTQRNNPAYSEAEKTVARINSYRNMTSGQLARMFSGGKMTSIDLALLAKEDQSLAHQIAFTNSLNNKGKVDFERDQRTISDEILKSWHTDMNNNERAGLLANALSNDPNIANALNDSKAKANALGELQKSVLTVGQEVEDELKGKNVSKSYMQALKAKRSSRIHTAIASAQIDYVNAVNYQKDLINNKKYDIDYQRQLEQRKWQIGADTYKARLGQQITQKNALYNTKLGLQKAQWEFEQKISQNQHMQNDPKLATQALIDSYRKQGVMAYRSDQEIIDAVQRDVASGKSLGEVLTDLNKAFQSKDEYKTLQRLHNGQMSDAQKIQAQQNFALKQGAINHQYGIEDMAISNQYTMQNLLAQYNLKDRAQQKETVQEMIKNGASPESANAYMNYVSAGGVSALVANCKTTAQCGAGANDYLQQLGYGRLMGNSYESKTNHTNSKEAVVGGLAIWQPANGQPKYGHVGVVVGVEGDKAIIRDWNWSGDEKQKTHKVPISTINQSGGFMNPFTTQNGGVIGESVTVEGGGDADTWTNAINNGKISFENFVEMFKGNKDGQALITQVQAKINKNPEILYKGDDDAIVQDLTNKYNMINDVYSDTGFMNSVSGNAQFGWGDIGKWKSSKLGKIQVLLEDQVLQKLIDSKEAGATFGALSDTELQMLRGAASLLMATANKNDAGKITGFDLSEKDMREQVEIMRNMYQKAISKRTGKSGKEEEDFVNQAIQ